MKAKILVIGPQKAGKTALSNILSELSDTQESDYKPTVGCRIVEFESQIYSGENKTTKMDIELWDCSGDKSFSPCWPALAKDAHGAIFVYDPSETENKELLPWFDYFVQQQGLRDKQCVIFENIKSKNRRQYETNRLTSSLAVIKMHPGDDIDLVRKDFSNYFATVFEEVSQKREQEELNLLNI